MGYKPERHQKALAEAERLAGYLRRLRDRDAPTQLSAPEPAPENAASKELEAYKTAVRRCHDCGRPTTNYRCTKCLAKWRKKHGVPIYEKNRE